MGFSRKAIIFAQKAKAAFFAGGGQPGLEARELDSYLFNRDARMDEAWEPERDGARGESFIEAPSLPASRAFVLKTFHRMVRSVRAFKHELARARSQVVPAPRGRRRTLGIALGGGFARTIAHIGVLKVLEKEKIPVDFVAGTSAGAIIGAAYCGGLSANELEELACTARFRDFARWTLSRFGFCTTDRMVDFYARVVKLENFEDLKIPLAVTATDVRTGAAVVFTKGPLVDPVRASCAYPGMFPPVEVDGRSLIDGMLAYPVPTTPLHAMGADCVLGVYLSARWSQQPGPRNLFELIGRCFSIMEAKMCDLWKKDADFVLEPDIDGFSFDCFERAKELIAKGEEAARAALPQLRRLLHSS
jgi:NTE family protein